MNIVSRSFALIGLCLKLILSNPVIYSDDYLDVTRYDTEELHACYGRTNSERAGICFVIRQDYIHISTKDGILLSQYSKLGEDAHYMQAMDKAFFKYKTFEIPLSGRVLKGMEFLKDFFADLLNGFLGATPQSKKDHGARNHRKFSTQQQVRLLAGASAVLKSNPKFPQIAEMIGNFHLLCRSLVQVYKHKHGSRGPESVEEHPAVDAPEISEVHPTVKDPVIGLPEAKQTNQNGACADVRANVTSPDCFGMCGPHCWCWNWICGDCCLHRGCQQHDLCCNHNYLSTHCLFPWIYGFSCHEGYHGYPECLCS